MDNIGSPGKNETIHQLLSLSTFFVHCWRYFLLSESCTYCGGIYFQEKYSWFSRLYLNLWANWISLAHPPSLRTTPALIPTCADVGFSLCWNIQRIFTHINGVYGDMMNRKSVTKWWQHNVSSVWSSHHRFPPLFAPKEGSLWDYGPISMINS